MVKMLGIEKSGSLTVEVVMDNSSSFACPLVVLNSI